MRALAHLALMLALAVATCACVARSAAAASAPSPPPAASAPTAPTPDASPHAARLYGAPETVVRRAPIAPGAYPHGELVMLRRGDAIVVRTTLVSALLGRGLQAIRRKEQARWPEGKPGHDDSLRYLAALDAGEDAARDEFLHRKNPNDDRRKMMIELVSSADSAFFAVYAIDARRQGDVFEVISARPVRVEDVSASYAAGAMRAQASGAFHVSGAELEGLLAVK